MGLQSLDYVDTVHKRFTSMAEESNTKVTIEQPGVAVSQETKKGLVWIGILLVAAAIVAAGVNWADGGETTETTKPDKDAPAQVEKVTKTKNGPSDSLLTALLGVGAGLIAIGYLYGRISSIKLPGGTEIGLTPEEKKATVQKAAEEINDPKKVAEVAQKAEDLLLAQKQSATATTLPPTQISETVKTVAQTVA